MILKLHRVPTCLSWANKWFTTILKTPSSIPGFSSNWEPPGTGLVLGREKELRDEQCMVRCAIGCSTRLLKFGKASLPGYGDMNLSMCQQGVFWGCFYCWCRVLFYVKWAFKVFRMSCWLTNKVFFFFKDEEEELD